MKQLKTLALTVSTVALVGTIGPSTAHAGGTLTVVNRNSTRAIQRVWFANAGERTDPWQAANVDAAIAPQSRSVFTLSGPNCLFDIKVRFSDGYESSFGNVNVCRGDHVVAD